MPNIVFRACAAIIFLTLPIMSSAVELVMVERQGCHYCIKWKTDIAPIYPKTDVGQFAPLRIVDIADTRGAGDAYKTPVIYTPTFVLMQDGVEFARMEGFASEDFFWGVLEMILERETEFEAQK